MTAGISRAAIAAQNDRLRTTLAFGPRARVLVTRGIAALPADEQAAILGAIVRFDAFTPDNDPYGEHDCAILEVAGHRVIWKISYYDDATLTFGAADPRDSYRVLTIMLAEEY
jgi:hypothetical protein